MTLIVLVSVVTAVVASASTTITDSEIETTGILRIGPGGDGEKFVLSNGNFAHKPGLIKEVFCLRDNESGGPAQYLGGAKDVFVQGKYAYVAGLDDYSLSVVDISNPENITEVSGINASSVNGSAAGLDGPTAVYVSGNYAYVVSRKDNNGSLSVIDISDPSHPTEIGILFDNETTHFNNPFGAYVAGGYAYVASVGDDALSVIDVSDPTNPHEVGWIAANSSYHMVDPFAMTISGKYAYVMSHYQYILTAVDISDPANPTWVGELYNDETNFLRDVSWGGIYVSGRYAYIASNSGDSLSIVDVSDPTDMKRVSMIIDDNLGGNATMLDRAKKVFIAGKYAYVTAITDEAFSVFDISDPYNITELGYLQDDSIGGSADCLEQPQGVFVQGKYAYVTSNADNALSVIDIGGIDTPSINTGSIQSNILSVTELAMVSGDLFIKNALNVGGFSWFGSGMSILGSLRVFENVTAYGSVISSGGFVHGTDQGISGNFTNGNCWTAYSGGIVYATNCTAM